MHLKRRERLDSIKKTRLVRSYLALLASVCFSLCRFRFKAVMAVCFYALTSPVWSPLNSPEWLEMPAFMCFKMFSVQRSRSQLSVTLS